MTSFSADDYRYMALALQLAERGRYGTHPNPRVGCVVVRNGEIVGSGWHRQAGGPHAEVEALRTAGEAARGATAYVTLEPCSHHGRTPPCCSALIEAGVGRVVAAMQDPNPQVAGRGLHALRQAGITAEAGLLSDQAEALNPGFLRRMRSGLPYVRLKVAASLDGRTAVASGESKWITSAEARRDVHRLRAEAGAVLTGSGTAVADDPSLTVRDFELPPWRQQPLRVVLDSTLKMGADAAMLGLPGHTLIACARPDPQKQAALEASGAEIAVLPEATGRVDAAALLSLLGRREINDVLVEAGAGLGGSMLQAGLVDELVLYLAPHLLGHEGRPLLRLAGLHTMGDRLDLDVRELRQIGPDIRIRAFLPRG